MYMECLFPHSFTNILLLYTYLVLCGMSVCTSSLKEEPSSLRASLVFLVLEHYVFYLYLLIYMPTSFRTGR